MPRNVPPPAVRFTFDPQVAFADAAETLELARVAVVGLFGPERVDLDLEARTNPDAGTIDIDRATDAGGATAVIFLKYCRAEFGPAAVRMERLRRRTGPDDRNP